MDWNALGSLFCIELALGTFVFLALASKAPVSPFFFRMNGGLALFALGGAWWIHLAKNPPANGATFALLAGGSLLAFGAYLPVLGPIRSELRRKLLWASTAGLLLALFAAVGAAAAGGTGKSLLFAASAALSGLIVGGVGIAMAFGHCYLTVPGMEVSYLGSLNRATVAAMLLKLFFLGAFLFVFAADLGGEEKSLFRPSGYFHLGTRLLVGLAMPLVFAWMVFGCLRHKATRSATGILYASTVLVILGEAMGHSLWGEYGVPL